MSAGAANTPVALRDLGSKITICSVPTVLHGAQVVNNQAAVAFVQIFGTDPTLGTTNPILEIQVAANSSATLALGADRGCALPGTGFYVASTTTEKGATPSAAGVQFFAQYRNP